MESYITCKFEKRLYLIRDSYCYILVYVSMSLILIKQEFVKKKKIINKLRGFTKFFK